MKLTFGHLPEKVISRICTAIFSAAGGGILYSKKDAIPTAQYHQYIVQLSKIIRRGAYRTLWCFHVKLQGAVVVIRDVRDVS